MDRFPRNSIRGDDDDKEDLRLDCLLLRLGDRLILHDLLPFHRV